jgi:hypothetical protein
MPTPKAPKESPDIRPDEAGLTGGSPAEGNLPTEIEVVVVNRYGNKEVRTVREISYNSALKEVARMIYYDIAEEIVKEVLEDLPRPQFWAYIYNLATERAYKVEMRRKHLTEVIVIPKHRAIYYFGGMEILGLDAYIPIEALYVKKQEITYYHIVRSTTAIDAIKQDLEKLLEGGK